MTRSDTRDTTASEHSEQTGHPNAGPPAEVRREEPGDTGVHPGSAGWPEGDMPIRRQGEWGQGPRGLEGSEDSGESELSPPGIAPTPGSLPAEGARMEDSELGEGSSVDSGPEPGA